MLNFKQARALAREQGGGYIGVYEQESRGWFVQREVWPNMYGPNPRAIFYVRRNGSLRVVSSMFAKNYQKKYFKNMQEKLDIWDLWYYNNDMTQKVFSALKNKRRKEV